jgi:hypothetical protein
MAPPPSDRSGRAALADLVRQFLRRGGVITVCPPCGEGGLPHALTRGEQPEAVAARKALGRRGAQRGGGDRRHAQKLARGGASP